MKLVTFGDAATGQDSSINISTTPSTWIPPELTHDEIISKQLRVILLPLIVFIGTIGNGLSIIVLLRRRMRGKSVYIYLFVLSCSDTAVLYFSAFKTWIFEITNWELLHVSTEVCKMSSFLILVALHCSSWLIVLVTIDRSVAVWSPLRAATMCSLRQARCISGILILTSVFYNAHVLWTFSLYSSDNRLYCYGNPQLTFMGYPFEVFKLISYCFVPFSIVLTLNCIIIYKIRMTRKGLMTNHPPTYSTGHVSPIRLTHAKITYMLLAVSFTWLLMTAPFSLLIFMGKVYSSKVGKTICFLLMYTNHSVNFFLYCLTGKKFRRELKELFTVNKRTPHSSRANHRISKTDKFVIVLDDSNFNGHNKALISSSDQNDV